MSPSENVLIALARAISDGSEVDWARVERSATTDEERAALAQLRSIQRITGVQRMPPGTPSADLDGVGFDADTEDAASPGPSPGPATWGSLEILELLDSGSFGDVYRARDPHLDREVALKLLPPLTEDAAQEAIVGEARRLAKVRHPNVVTIHGADVVDGRVGIWCELATGTTLQELLVSQGPFGPQEAGNIGLELTRALAAVHGAGLVHGDLKPQNVMREEGGRILLMDFGSVSDIRRADASVSVESTSGTPLFMAPELLRGQAPAVASDIYSLGVLLYYLVTRAYPFKATSVGELRKAHEAGVAVPLGDLRPDLPIAFVRIIHRALAHDPEDRFASAGEFQQALANLEPPGPVMTRTRGWWLGAVGILVAIALSMVYLSSLLVPTNSSEPAYTVNASMGRVRAGNSTHLNPGAAVEVGDDLFLEFRASRDLFVYVINEDEQGNTYLLFPLPELDLENPLAGDISHRLPGSRGGVPFNWTVTSIGGREHFLMVASPDRLEDLEPKLEELPRAGAPEGAGAMQLPPRAVSRLRGVGGLRPADPGKIGALSPVRLSELAEGLSSPGTSVRGVWVRRFEFSNPPPEE